MTEEERYTQHYDNFHMEGVSWVNGMWSVRKLNMILFPIEIEVDPIIINLKTSSCVYEMKSTILESVIEIFKNRKVRHACITITVNIVDEGTGRVVTNECCYDCIVEKVYNSKILMADTIKAKETLRATALSSIDMVAESLDDDDIMMEMFKRTVSVERLKELGLYD